MSLLVGATSCYLIFRFTFYITKYFYEYFAYHNLLSSLASSQFSEASMRFIVVISFHISMLQVILSERRKFTFITAITETTQ